MSKTYWFYSRSSKHPKFEELIDQRCIIVEYPYSNNEPAMRLSTGDTLLMYEGGIGIAAIGTLLERSKWELQMVPVLVPGMDAHGYQRQVPIEWFLNLSENPVPVEEVKRRLFVPGKTIRKIVGKRRIREIEELIDRLSRSENVEIPELIEKNGA